MKDGIPRWMLAIPLFFSFAVLQPIFWGWNLCRLDGKGLCNQAGDLLSWLGGGFPLPAIYPLSMVVDNQWLIFGVSVLLVLGMCLVGRLLLPSRLKPRVFAAIITGWLAVSVLGVLATPYLMAWAWSWRFG